ncbi:family 78 glycoside hydrolase catalytic domain [Nocardia thailandica]
MYQLPARWHGLWISPTEPTEPSEYRPAYLLARTFDVGEPVAHGRLYATALGVYEAYLNSVRVGDAELTPGFTNYDRTVYSQSFDVTDLLRPGTNELVIVLSDGWYRGRTGSEQQQNSWGGSTAALAQLEIRSLAGARRVIPTDNSWTSRRSHITSADLIAGQTTDYHAPTGMAQPVRVGAVRPPQPELSPAPPVRRVQELAPLAVFSPSEDVSVLDFGRNIAGWVRLTNLGTPGTTTTLEFGEHLTSHRDLTTAHLDVHTPAGSHIPFRQVDRVIAGGDDRAFEPRHTVHGFRYVKVTHPGRKLSASDATAIVVHTDMARTGWFASSDERLDRLHEAGLRTFLANAVDIPTDCPTRERQGWTGDFQVFAPTAAMMFDIEGFAAKWLRAVRDDQYDNGCVAMFSPDPARMKHSDRADRIGGGAAGWGDAAISVPWTIYQHYGNIDILRASWTSARAWVEYALRCARTYRHAGRAERHPIAAPHEQFIWDGPFHFGEWLEPHTDIDTDPATAFQTLLATDHGEVGTAYLYRSTRQLSDIAELLGRRRQAEMYGEIAEKVRAAWQKEFFDTATGRTMSDSQAAYTRAISFGLLPEHLVHAAANRLVNLIRAADNHLTTGFLSTGLLLPVLADTGHSEVAYSLLTRAEQPSWLAMLEAGGGTYWENWNGIDRDGNAHGSLNHYSKGAVVGFLYSHVAGLRQAEGSAGWRQFTVAPLIGGGLTHAAASLRTPQGAIRTEWTRRAADSDTVAVTVTVPAGAVATLRIPGNEPLPLESGTTTKVVRQLPIDLEAAMGGSHTW